MYPYSEKKKENPLSIVGMFDPSARPHIEPRKLTFATPMKRFNQLIGHMEDSFLITDTWKEFSRRME